MCQERYCCTIIMFLKTIYVQNLPQIFPNQSHLPANMTIHLLPCIIYLQQPYWSPNQQATKYILIPTTSYQKKCQHLPPFSHTQKRKILEWTAAKPHANSFYTKQSILLRNCICMVYAKGCSWICTLFTR